MEREATSAQDPALEGKPPTVVLFIFCFALWLLLTGSLAADEIIAGLAVSAVTAWISRSRAGILSGLRLTPSAPVHMLVYFFAFWVALLKANLDVARRVLSPSLPLRPGMVEIHTKLHSELGRLLLANSITLTPGTLTVDVEGDRLLIHWIDCPPGLNMEEATRAIAADFEKHIRGFLK